MKDTDSPEQRRQQGNECFTANDFEGAILHYDAAIRGLRAQRSSATQKDGLLKCLTNRANARFRLEQYEQAAQDASEALRVDEGYVKARFRRACAYEALDRQDEAARDFELCLKQGGLDARGAARCQQFLDKRREEGETEGRGEEGPTAMELCPSASDDPPAAPLPPPPVVSCSNVVRVRFSGGPAAGQPHPALARQPPPPTRKGPPSLPYKRAASLGTRARAVCKGASVFPSRRRQRQAVGQLMRQAEGYQLEEGDTYALVWAQWWQCWKEFVQWTDTAADKKGQEQREKDDDEDDDEEEVGNGGLTPVPPPIDNRALLALGYDRLKPCMEQCVDYEALPVEAWNALLSWYGGGPAILRQMKLTEAGELWLDMTSPLTPAANDHAQQPTSMQVDEEPAADGTMPCVVCQALTTKRCSKCRKLTYCSKGCQASHWRYHRPQCRDDGKPYIDKARRGKTGLINLGNTCYLNSALQCLSHTYPITMHLLTNRFKDDLNEHSPLGTGGRLAREYEALVKELWLGGSGAVSPSALKKAISRIAPQFAGNSQHDAQEVLINLLDRLHEDLNRVKKKPYIKAPEDDDRPDSIQGPEAWHRLKQREDSVLYDTLYGQFKSQLMCGVCRKVSTVFDPFGMVTLEIPDVSQRRMHVLLFPNPPTPAANDKAPAASSNGADVKPRLLTLKVNRRASVWDLKQEVSQVSGVGRDSLIMANITSHIIYDFLKDNMPISRLRDDWGLNLGGSEAEFILAAYETPPMRQYSYMVLLHRQRVKPATPEGEGEGEGDARQEEEEELQVIGLPLLLVFSPEWSCKQLQEHIWKRIKPMVRSGDTHPLVEELDAGCLRLVLTDNMGRELEATRRHAAEAAREEGEGEGEEEGEGARGMDVVDDASHSSTGSGGAEEDKESMVRREACVGRYLPHDDEAMCGDYLEIVTGAFFVALDWDGALQGRCGYDDVLTRPALPTHTSRPSEGAQSDRVTLAQCLKKFSSPERLDRDNAWYCTRCKKHTEAVKSLHFWRLPRVLILSLKRFDYRRERKIETEVEFPLSDLDLSRHCHNPEGKRYIYDLYAVCNHYGSRSWGHYTAFARQWGDKGWIDRQWYHFDDSDWEAVSESAVLSKDAYMLFYRLRDLDDDPHHKTHATAAAAHAHTPGDEQTPGAAATGTQYNQD